MIRSRNYHVAGLSLVAVWLFGGNSYSHAQTNPLPTRYRLSVADKKWALELEIPTFHQPVTHQPSKDQLAFANPVTSFTKDGETAWLSAFQNRPNGSDLPFLSVFVQPAMRSLTPEEFRVFAFKKLTKNAHSEKHLQHNQIPITRYGTEGGAVGSYPGIRTDTVNVTLTARNLEAYLVKDDIWVRIRFTALTIKPDGEQLFYSVLDSARFVDVSNPTTSFDHYSVGRALAAKNEFRRAVGSFTSAVTLERNQPQLEVTHWRDLIKKSAEAHVALSDFVAAAEVLEYGVARDSTNETLLMQLARTYAALSHPEKTLATLKKAFLLMKQRKEIFEKTTFPGTTSHSMSLPDLNRDPAFKEMMKDKTFREAVKAMKNSP